MKYGGWQTIIATTVWLLLIPNLVSADNPDIVQSFPRASIGIAGLTFRSNHANYQDYLINDCNGWIFGYEVDAEFRIGHIKRTAFYLAGSFAKPSSTSDYTSRDFTSSTTTTYTLHFNYLNVGGRLVRQANMDSRIWIEGGLTFLRMNEQKNTIVDPENIENIQGWYTGIGSALPLHKRYSLYFHLTYISTQKHTSTFDVNYYYIRRRTIDTAYGGLILALGIRYEL